MLDINNTNTQQLFSKPSELPIQMAWHYTIRKKNMLPSETLI